jgi:hypothetical protein
VVWPKWDADATPLLLLKQGFHHGVHINTPLEVRRFEEITLPVTLDIAQVDKVDARGKATGHSWHIVVGTGTEGARAKTEAVGGEF